MLATPIPPVHLQTQPFCEILKTPDEVVTIEPKVKSAISFATPVHTVLQDLASVDGLHITKKLQMKSVLFLRGKKNKFLVRSGDQTLVYTIDEENKWWVGYFFYGLRPLTLRICDNQGEEVMSIVRPYACTTRVLPCSLQRCSVFSPPGTLLGSVEQQWSPVKPLYVVRNRDRDIVFWIFGPAVTISCYSDIRFRITRAGGAHVGATCKKWQGIMHALFFAPVTDRFSITFDVDLSVEEKALLLATTLLLDYMYYDS